MNNNSPIVKGGTKREEFIRKLKRASRSIRREGFDDSMLYSIMFRVAREVVDLSTIKFIDIGNSSKKINTKVSKRKFIHIFNNSEKIGTKIITYTPIPIWGHPEIGNLQYLISHEDTGVEVLSKNIYNTPIIDDSKIYIILMKKEEISSFKTNVGVEVSSITNEYSLVLIKNDDKKNSVI